MLEANPNSNCDVAKPITHTDIETIEGCEAFCTSECGEEAGSSFTCWPKKEEPQQLCNSGEDFVCTCLGCEDHGVPVPKDMYFGNQCSAFCDRADVCDDIGFAATCTGGSSGASSTSGRLVLTTVAGLVAALWSAKM